MKKQHKEFYNSLEQGDKPKHNNGEIYARIAQSVFFAILALGVSSGAGDYAKFVASPFSQFSVTAFVFGLIGIVVTEIIARVAKKW
jgi:uncharacterized protein YacL